MVYRPEDESVPKRKGSLSSRAIIADATRNSLLRAEELKLESIAFPALAAGVGAFPVDECAEVMIGAAREYAGKHANSTIQRVRFVLFSPQDCKIFQIVLQTINRQ